MTHQITKDEMTYAIANVYGESCSWGRDRGKACTMCDCSGMTEAYAREAARAVLNLIPVRRETPTRDDYEGTTAMIVACVQTRLDRYVSTAMLPKDRPDVLRNLAAMLTVAADRWACYVAEESL